MKFKTQTLCFGLFCLFAISPVFGQHYTESPDVIKALTRYHVSHEFARQRLVRDLEKSQMVAMSEKKLDEAVTIQAFREEVKQGVPLPTEHSELREGLVGNRYQWGQRFEKRSPIYFTFSLSEVHYDSPNRVYQRPYITMGSREIQYGDNPIRLLFSPDLQRLILLDEDFALRTGVCVNPRSDAAMPANLPTAPALARGRTAGQEWAGNYLGMPFCWCPPGTFLMGSPPTEPGHQESENQVQVTLTKGFWLGRHEVTQGAWQTVMGSTPWRGKKYVLEGPDFPASHVAWHEARIFCERLTIQEREAGRLPEGWEYAVPTEAQWEYACRAGTTTKYSFGNSETELSQYAWWGGLEGNGNTVNEQYIHKVGTKKANPWGLRDMHGNVLEWCADYYQAVLPGGTDPKVATVASALVTRGGNWSVGPGNSRSASREKQASTARHGFRVAVIQTEKGT